jgi:hypothetical protein
MFRQISTIEIGDSTCEHLSAGGTAYSQPRMEFAAAKVILGYDFPRTKSPGRATSRCVSGLMCNFKLSDGVITISCDRYDVGTGGEGGAVEYQALSSGLLEFAVCKCCDLFSHEVVNYCLHVL